MPFQFSHIIQILFFFIVVGTLIVFGVYWYQKAPESEALVHEATFMQYQSRAAVYRERMTEYAGVCADLAVGPGSVCLEGPDTFRVTHRLSENEGWYCLDATGFVGQVKTLPTNRAACR